MSEDTPVKKKRGRKPKNVTNPVIPEQIQSEETPNHIIQEKVRFERCI